MIYIAQNIQDYSEPKLIRAIIHRIVVSKNLIEITYNEASIKKVLNALANNQEIVITDKNEELTSIVISKNIKITQSSRNDNILILNAKEYDTPEPNPYLVNAIVKSFYYHKLMFENKLTSEQKANTHIYRLMKLRFLPKEIIEAILTGTQEQDLTIDKLYKYLKT